MGSPESIESYAGRIAAAQEAAGGPLPVPPGFVDWDTFPFETSGLRLKTVDLGDEEPRVGEDDPALCAEGSCPGQTDEAWPRVWADANWLLKLAPPSGSPLIVLLEPHAHVDLPDLPSERAAELGQLTVLLTKIVEELPSVGRCHVARYGDGAAHGHLWFLARPTRMPRLRGSFMGLWDDLIPAVPTEVRDANAAYVVERLLATHGGRALEPLA